MSNPIQGKNIFVLDDDLDFIALVAKILENAGAQIHSATNLDHAQEVFDQTQPHLALIDLNLSENTSGKQFINYIRQLPHAQQVPVVVVSAHNDSRTLSEFGKDEIEEFIVKPIRSDIFVRKIRNIFHKKKDQIFEYTFDYTHGLKIDLDCELIEISEIGCRLDAPASIGENTSVQIESSFLEHLGINACHFVASGLNTISKNATYKNDIDFIGLDEKTLTMLRKVKQFK